MILLDTNVVSELMKMHPDPRVLSWLDKQSGNDLFTSAITKAEIELGIALLSAGKRRDGIASAANTMFNQDFSHRVLSFDEAAAGFYAALVSHRSGIGRPISVEDAQIAAIALRHGFVLATRNVKDFLEIESLQVIDPWLMFQN